MLPAALAARRDGWQAVVVPMDNLAEASLVDGIEVLGVGTLSQLQGWLDGAARLAERVSAGQLGQRPAATSPMSSVRRRREPRSRSPRRAPIT